MPLQVEVETRIKRPRAAVAAVMFDPMCDPIWTGGVVEVKPLAPGRLTRGALVDRVSEFMGKRIAYRITVVDARADELVEMTVGEPLDIRVRYELEDADRGTLVRIRVQGGERGLFSSGGMLVTMMVRRNLAQDLERLKRHVEGGAA